MRKCPGVDLLRKEMLIYELKMRGEPCEGTQAELVARLRGALQKPVDTSVIEASEETKCLGQVSPLPL